MQNQDHFDVESWADFVRGHAAPEAARAMSEHVDGGCEPCGRSAALWQEVTDLAGREASFEPPVGDVRCARSMFDAFQPKKSGPFRLHFARLVGFGEPALAGFRGPASSAKEYVFEAGDLMLHLHVDSAGEPGVMSMVGQLFDSAELERDARGRSVSLQLGDRIVAGAPVDEFGEFQLEFKSEQNLLLIVKLDEAAYFLSRLPSDEE